jgi:transcriptional antiterminator RfaH
MSDGNVIAALQTRRPKGKMPTIKITFGVAMHWYLVHTKPKQEKCALDNLHRQGYQCYLPTIPSEKLRKGRLIVVDEPLFPRYLFIRLGQGVSTKSWAPIRSTKGVSRLVSFGIEPARVDDGLIEQLRTQQALVQTEPERLFKQGEHVRLTKAPFTSIEGIYQMADGERRVMVLIEILSKPVAVRVATASLRKVRW